MRCELPDIKEENIAKWSGSKKGISPGLRSESDIDMAEIVSPFRQRDYSPEKDENHDNGWTINPIKVQRMKEEEKIQEATVTEENDDYESSPNGSPCGGQPWAVWAHQANC